MRWLDGKIDPQGYIADCSVQPLRRWNKTAIDRVNQGVYTEKRSCRQHIGARLAQPDRTGNQPGRYGPGNQQGAGNERRHVRRAKRDCPGITAFPVGGLMTTGPVADIAPKAAAFRKAIGELGLDPKSPILPFAVFSLPAGPGAKVTDLGIWDADKQSLVPLFV